MNEKRPYTDLNCDMFRPVYCISKQCSSDPLSCPGSIKCQPSQNNDRYCRRCITTVRSEKSALLNLDLQHKALRFTFQAAHQFEQLP